MKSLVSNAGLVMGPTNYVIYSFRIAIAILQAIQLYYSRIFQILEKLILIPNYSNHLWNLSQYCSEDQKKLKGKVTSQNETILPVSSSIGVTRLADITDMDILRIPNFSRSTRNRGTFGSIVEKESTKFNRSASALMESIERYCSLPSGNQNRMIQTSYKEVSNVSKTLHPTDVVEPMLFEYDEDMDYAIRI